MRTTMVTMTRHGLLYPLAPLWCLLLGASAALAGPASSGGWTHRGDDFDQGLFTGAEVDDAGRLTLASFEGLNMALGRRATAGTVTLVGTRSVTDGDVATDWRFNNRTDVLGQRVQVDLDGDRGITQVRILPGRIIDQRPNFFLKGYRLYVSTERAPDDWILVAQHLDNDQPVVDTRAASSWIEVDDQGAPLPVLGRYVRVEVAREDPPNWVSIGEIEVYGSGYRAAGSFESAVLDAGRPVHVGRVRFGGSAPAGTDLRVQVRTSADATAWAEWHRVPVWDVADGAAGVAVTEPGPARFVQYRVVMETRRPLQTPSLDWIEVDYTSQYPASVLTAAIEPRRPVLGEETLFTCVVEADIGPQDQGFAHVQVNLPGQIQAVRLNGAPLPAAAYTARWDTDGLTLHLQPEYRLTHSGSLAIDFAAVLLRPTLAIRAGVASAGAREQRQYAQPAGDGSLILEGRGFLERALPRDGVVVQPNPFDPGLGPAHIQLDLANVQHPRPLHVAVYDLRGRRVRRLLDGEPVTAGRRLLQWDGRDQHGRRVPPGLYVLRVDIRADREDVWLGTLGVLY